MICYESVLYCTDFDFIYELPLDRGLIYNIYYI